MKSYESLGPVDTRLFHPSTATLVPNSLSQLIQNARSLQRRQVFLPAFVSAVHLYSKLIESRACQGFQGSLSRVVSPQNS